MEKVFLVISSVFLLALLTFWSTISCLSAENMDKVKGGYKQCTEYTYNYSDGKLDRTSKTKESIYRYNSKGNISSYVYYNQNGSVFSKCFYKYNKKEQLIEKLWYNAKDSIDGKETYNYNEKGKLIERLKHSSQGIAKEIHKYDDAGNEIEYEYNNGGSVYWKYLYSYNEYHTMIGFSSYNSDTALVPHKCLSKYDTKGRHTESVCYNPDGSVYSRDSSEYNDEGYSIYTNITYNSDGTIKTKNTSEYDDKNNLIAESEYPSYSFLHPAKDSLRYDDNGNKIEDEDDYFPEGHYLTRTTYAYDSKGKIIEEVHYNHEGQDFSDTYKYDNKGNLIEQLSYDEFNGDIPEKKTVYIYSK
jgi:hypothetical protein